MTACMCLLPASAYQPCEVILSIKCTIILRGGYSPIRTCISPTLISMQLVHVEWDDVFDPT